MTMTNTLPNTGASLALVKWRWLCLALARVATASLLFVPVLICAAILFPASMPFHIDSSFPLTGAIPMPYRIGILVCEAAPTGLGLWGAWSMRQLFLGFSEGEVFTAGALGHLRAIALALLLSEMTGLLMQLPQSALASWANGPGHRTMSLGLNTHDIGNLFLAGVAFVIARVMAEAQRIAADHAEII